MTSGQDVYNSVHRFSVDDRVHQIDLHVDGTLKALSNRTGHGALAGLAGTQTASIMNVGGAITKTLSSPDASIDDFHSSILAKVEMQTGYGSPTEKVAFLTKTFKYYDIRGKGTLNFEEYHQAIESFNVYAYAGVLRHVFDSFADGIGALDYRAYVYQVLDLHANGRENATMRRLPPDEIKVVAPNDLTYQTGQPMPPFLGLENHTNPLVIGNLRGYSEGR